jgi:hypothetical protein
VAGKSAKHYPGEVAMKFIDDLIVALATRLLRGVMAIGTGLVYIQFFALALLLTMVGTVTVAVMLTAAKNALLGS